MKALQIKILQEDSAKTASDAKRPDEKKEDDKQMDVEVDKPSPPTNSESAPKD